MIRRRLCGESRISIEGGIYSARYFGLKLHHAKAERCSLQLKSKYEYLTRDDFPMSIVFSAMAFECQISHAFFEWTRIDSQRAGNLIDDDRIEKMLRNKGSIRDKIEDVCRLMDSRGIDEFVKSSSGLSENIQTKYPNLNIGSLAKNFQETVFWPRNRVLHRGFTEFKKEDANRSHNVATMGIRILDEMDLAGRAQ